MAVILEKICRYLPGSADEPAKHHQFFGEILARVIARSKVRPSFTDDLPSCQGLARKSFFRRIRKWFSDSSYLGTVRALSRLFS